MDQAEQVAILMGNGFLKAGMFNDARTCYLMAGEDIPKTRLIECGDACIAKGCITDAEEIYKVAVQSP